MIMLQRRVLVRTLVALGGADVAVTPNFGLLVGVRVHNAPWAGRAVLLQARGGACIGAGVM